MENTKILMIEDDPELAEMLIEYLAQYHFDVDNYEDPFMGISALNVNKYDLMLLDLSLPGKDGLEVCQEVRKKFDLPIIISSARSDLDDKISGLQLGADDYLPKPYEPKELYARIMSVLRRYRHVDKEEEKKTVFKVDHDGREIYFKEERLKLTRAEYEILSYMIKRHSHAISRKELLNNSPSLHDEESSRSLDVIIGRIRSKLGDDSRHPAHLHSVRGLGYKLEG